MRCKKGQVVMTCKVVVSSKDHKGKRLYGNAEKLVESVLSQTFKAYVQHFGKKISIKFPDIVEVIANETV